MAGVPDPRVAPGLGLEVGPADVVDLGGEAQQTSVSVRPVGLGCRLGQTVLLSGTVEHVQRTILDVNRLLHQRSVQDEVRGRWVEREEQDIPHIIILQCVSPDGSKLFYMIGNIFFIQHDDRLNELF